MTGLPLRIRHLATAAALAGTLALGGCGGIDGLDLNGKLFDFLGVSSSALEGNKSEPQLAARAPLVLPPSSDRLPEPGADGPGKDDLAALRDPELKKLAAAKERERLHLAYCRGEIQWKDRAYNPEAVNRSPYGPCSGLMGSMVKSINKE